MTALFAHALDAAVNLHRQAGYDGDAERWEHLVDTLRCDLQKTWSDKEGLFLDICHDCEDAPSQHNQIMAILANAATPEQTQRIRERLLDDPTLHTTKLMQNFYLARASKWRTSTTASPTC